MEVIMKPTNFAIQLTNFLCHYLSGQRNLSQNTIKAYRDTFILLLEFCRDVKNIPVEKLCIEHINVALVDEFIKHLEKERCCKICTLNHRLATLHAFFRYLQIASPEYLLQCQQILSIPLQRFVRETVEYLSKEHLALLLAQPNLNTKDGRRDAVILSVLYDTGARVQELIDMSVGDLRLTNPAQIRILGKGRKIRIVPLMQNTVKLMQDYLREFQLETSDKFDYPLFQSHSGKCYLALECAIFFKNMHCKFENNILNLINQ